MKWSRIIALAWIVLVVFGCAQFVKRPGLVSDLTAYANTTYPRESVRGDDLDIYVERHGDTITLNNLTAQTYTELLLWINQAYVGQVDRIEIGVGNRMDLSWFVNRHGEPYPKGAFLQPDKSFPIVLAELFDPVTGRRYRLIVRTEPA